MGAAEQNSDHDSEEENNNVKLLLNDEGHPILPELGNMPLEKAKQTICSYWTETYCNCLVFQSIHLAADIFGIEMGYQRTPGS